MNLLFYHRNIKSDFELPFPFDLLYHNDPCIETIRFYI